MMEIKLWSCVECGAAVEDKMVYVERHIKWHDENRQRVRAVGEQLADLNSAVDPMRVIG